MSLPAVDDHASFHFTEKNPNNQKINSSWSYVPYYLHLWSYMPPSFGLTFCTPTWGRPLHLSARSYCLHLLKCIAPATLFSLLHCQFPLFARLLPKACQCVIFPVLRDKTKHKEPLASFTLVVLFYLHFSSLKELLCMLSLFPSSHSLPSPAPFSRSQWCQCC